MKSCAKCKMIKELNEFYTDNTKKDGTGYTCKLCIKSARAVYYQNNKELIIKRNYQNPNRILNNKKYRANNKEKITKDKCIYLAKRRLIDENFRIRTNLSHRLYKALKGICKSTSTLKLLGCTIAELKQHLETKFTIGMSWDNYGRWHIDHVTPCASFDLTDPEQQRKCFHYSNLQPLWAIDNLRKSCFLP